MSAKTTHLLSSGEFYKLRCDTINFKSASANVYFYTNNSKIPNFEFWHSCRKWTVCLAAPWRTELVTGNILHWTIVILVFQLHFSLIHYENECRLYQNSVSFQPWNYELRSAWDWTAKFILSCNITTSLLPTISPATFNSDCK
jgi:hypothetical protein